MTDTEANQPFVLDHCPWREGAAASEAHEAAGLFDRFGVLAVEGFFSPEQLAAANAALDAHWQGHQGEATTQRGSAFDKFACDVLAWSPVEKGQPDFAALAADATLAAATADLLGADHVNLYSLVMYTLPGQRGQAWHQDCLGEDPKRFNVNRLIYTRDVTAQAGQVVVVPGSHRMGDIPRGEGQQPMDGEVALSPEAGTVVFLHGRVFHRVTPNQTHGPRISVNLRVAPQGTDANVTSVGVYRNGRYDFDRQQAVEEV